MRLGLFVTPDRPVATQALAAEEHAFDLLWLDEARGPAAAAPLVEAAFLGSIAPSIRIATAVHTGVHPVSLAEEAAVADLALEGRLTVALRSGAGGRSELDETVAVLRSAWTARPFRHEGSHWRIPANLPGNTGWVEHRIRVTPTPAQLHLPLWLVGTDASEVAAEHGLPVVGDAEPLNEVSVAWARIEERMGRAAMHLHRAALWDVPAIERSDVDSLARDLVEARDRCGIDVVVLRLPQLDDRRWRDALATIAHEVRPRVQLDALPPGTEAFWTEQRTEQIERTR